MISSHIPITKPNQTTQRHDRNDISSRIAGVTTPTTGGEINPMISPRKKQKTFFLVVLEISIRLYSCMHVYINLYIYICIYIYYIYIYILYIYTCVHIYIYTIYVHVYTHKHIQWQDDSTKTWFRKSGAYRPTVYFLLGGLSHLVQLVRPDPG